VLNVKPPATALGTGLENTVELSPSWPLVFEPQQNAAPAAVNAHESNTPAAMLAKRCPPITAIGA